MGRANTRAVPGFSGNEHVLTPEDVMGGVIPRGRTLVFDDDHFYLGGLLAEKLCAEGIEVVLVTPAECVSAWTHNTLEQHRIQRRLLELGVSIVTGRIVREFDAAHAALECVYTERRTRLAADCLVTVTSRLPNDALAVAIGADPNAVAEAGIVSVTLIGDCFAPSTIAAAVYAGHRYAREFNLSEEEATAFLREQPSL